METFAKLKFARLSPQKCRLVVDLIRGLPVGDALNILTHLQKRGALMVKKTLESAIANAENNFGADVDELHVSSTYVDEAPTFKRFRARAKGRGARILKRNCHITVKVADDAQAVEKE